MSSRYVNFGKYAINKYMLVEQNKLRIIYKNIGSTPSFLKKTRNISEYLVSLLVHILDTNTICQTMQKRLDYDETELFHILITKSGLRSELKYEKLHQSDEDRFNLLKSAYIAGNDSKILIEEMKLILKRVYAKQMISKEEFDFYTENL